MLANTDSITSLKQSRATVAKIAVALINQAGDKKLKQLEMIEFLYHGGDCVHKFAIDFLCCHSIDELNGYGPAEATIEVTAKRVRYGDLSTNVGHALLNSFIDTQSFSDGSNVPTGVPAELVISGNSVSRGYFETNGMAKSNFISTVKNAEQKIKTGSISYKTGDIAKQCNDGSFCLYGRKDFQVKLHGQRIELSEIEHVLMMHPSVHLAVALMIRDQHNQNQIAVYYTTADKLRTIDETMLGSHLKKHLASYMIPSHLIFLESIPVNVSGKIDRQKLNLVPIQKDKQSHLSVASSSKPSNEIEKIMVRCWETHLDKNAIFVNDNFFTLGGNSLNAITIINALQFQLKKVYTVQDLFNNPTVRQLSKMHGEKLTSSQINKSDPLSKLILSYNQEQMLFFNAGTNHDNGLYQQLVVACWPATYHIQNRNINLHCILQNQNIFRTIFPREYSMQLILSITEVHLNNEFSTMLRNGGMTQSSLSFAPFNQKPPVAGFTLTGIFNHSVLVVHHITTDAWSHNIIMQMMTQSFTDQHFQNSGGPVHVQSYYYVDFANWQRQQLIGERLATLKNFWKTHIEIEDGVFSLTSDRSVAQGMSTASNHAAFSLDHSYSTKIWELARAMTCTPSSTMLAIFLILLRNYAPSQSITIGCLSANRMMPQFTDIVGYFLNTILIQSTFDDTQRSFEEFARNKQYSLTLAYEHQELPLPLLVDILGSKRNVDHQHLFSILCNYRYNLAPFPNHILKIFEAMNQYDIYDLSFAIDEGQSISAQFTYDVIKFYRKTIQRLISTYFIICSKVISSYKIDQNFLSISNEVSLHSNININEKFIGDFYLSCGTLILKNQLSMCLPKLFLKNQNIINGCMQTLTETEKYANAVCLHMDQAAGLRALADQSVVVKMDKTITCVLSYYCAIVAGLAFVTILPDFPAERQNMISTIISAAITLTNSSHSKGGHSLLLSNDIHTRATNSKYDMLYVIFTSGSTGVPKGIAVNHQNVVNWTFSLASFPMVSNDSVFAQSLSFVFDGGLTNIFLSNATGAVQYLHANYTDPIANLKQSRATIAKIAVALINQADDKKIRQFKMVELLFHGGESVHKFAIDFICCHSIDELNAYGPAEATIEVTAKRVRHGDLSTNVGHALLNSFVNIKSFADGSYIPIGVPAELVVSGTSVSRGYFETNGMAKSNFISTVKNAEQKIKTGSISYKTGDIAKQCNDGSICLYGRKDFQVKLHGQRIELSEIEHVLMMHPPVHIAVALMISDQNNQNQIAVYYSTLDKIRVKDEAVLRNHLNKYLASYMVPSHLIYLETIPVNFSGKIDRRALPNPRFIPHKNLHAEFYEMSEVEHIILSIWESVLGIENIGVNDDFFAIGGNSLNAMQIVSQLRSSLGYNYTIRDIFEKSTVGKLTSAHSESGIHDMLCIEKIAGICKPQHLCLSHNQQQMWFYCQTNPNSYWVYTVFFWSKSQCFSVISLHTLLQSQSSFKTIFHPEGPSQMVLSSTESHCSAISKLNIGVTQQIQTDAFYDFTHKPPIVFMHSDRTISISLVLVHHIITDAWSTSLIHHWLTLQATQLSFYLHSTLHKQNIHYVDYMMWQEKQLRGQMLLDLQLFWQNAIKTHIEIHLPADRKIAHAHNKNVSVSDNSQIYLNTHKIASISKFLNTTTSIIMLTAFTTTLYDYTSAHIVPIGCVSANRIPAETQNIVGFFLNTLPLQIPFLASTTIMEQVSVVQHLLLEALEHQGLPFPLITDTVYQNEDLNHVEIISILFNFHYNMARLPSWIHKVMTYSGSTNYELVFEGTQDNSIHSSLKFASDKFYRKTITSLSRHLSKHCSEFINVVEAEKYEINHGHMMSRLTSLDYSNLTFNEQVGDSIVATLSKIRQICKMLLMKSDNELLSCDNLRCNSLIQKKTINVGPKPCNEQTVTIKMEKSPAHVFAFIRAIDLGFPFATIPSELPIARQRFMSTTVNAVIILDNKNASILHDQQCCRSYVGVTTNDLLYIIFTSGSTGVPKGIAVNQAAQLNYLMSVSTKFFTTCDSVILQSLNFVFDASLADIFIPITTGASIFVCKDFLEPLRYLKQSNATIAKIAVVLINQCYHSDMKLLNNLESLHHGGEVLKQSALDIIAGSAVSQNNTYGPAECTIHVTTKSVHLHDSAYNIGYPLLNTMIEIRDFDTLLNVPIGMPGELIVSGKNVSRGYYRKDRSTLPINFIQSQQCLEYKQKIGLCSSYKTGDIGKRGPDGSLTILNRKDFQVKLHGQRIELQEIEQALLCHADVKQAVALLVQTTDHDKQIIAFVVKQNEADNEHASLRATLRTSLPAIMIPSNILSIHEIPSSISGKTDRTELKRMYMEEVQNRSTHIGDGTQYSAKLDGNKREIFQIWTSVLGHSNFNSTNSFFEIGGNSILALRVAEEIRVKVSDAIRVIDILEKPTIDQLAHHLEGILMQNTDADKSIFNVYRTIFKSIDSVQSNIFDHGVDVSKVAKFFDLIKSMQPNILGKITLNDIFLFQRIEAIIKCISAGPEELLQLKYPASILVPIKVKVSSRTIAFFEHFVDEGYLQCFQLLHNLLNNLSHFGCHNFDLLKMMHLNHGIILHWNLTEHQTFALTKVLDERDMKCFCGHSVGGLLAYESALRLEQQIGLRGYILLIDSSLEFVGKLKSRMEHYITFMKIIAKLLSRATMILEKEKHIWTMMKLFKQCRVMHTKQQVFLFTTGSRDITFTKEWSNRCREKELCISSVNGDHMEMVQNKYNHMLCMKINAILAEHITCNH